MTINIHMYIHVHFHTLCLFLGCKTGASNVRDHRDPCRGRRGVGRYQVGPDVVKPQLEMAIVPETPLPPQPPLGRGMWDLELVEDIKIYNLVI